MICPECAERVPDGAERCPRCGADLAAADHPATFIFCEGCGARLSSRDRTCPKCGRPAPGILSAGTSASDLAAGRTASFPRLSGGPADALPERPTAASVLDSSIDPDATSVLSVSELGERSSAAAPAPDFDLYHDDRPRRRWPFVLGGLVAVCAVAAFFAVDPFGVVPQLTASIQRSAAEMFPSRTGAATGAAADGDAGDGADAAGEDDQALDAGHDVSAAPVEVTDDTVLTEDEAYDAVYAAWEEVGSYDDVIADVVADYNGGYLARDPERRREASQSAYDMRDDVRATIDGIDSIRLAHDSAYTEDLEHVRQLAEWMYNRVDVLCDSWDISLAIPEGESPADSRSEISAPLREALDASGRNQNLVQYEEHYREWMPRRRS